MIFLEYMTFCKCPADRALSGVHKVRIKEEGISPSVEPYGHDVIRSVARDRVTRGGRDNCITSSKACNEDYAKIREDFTITEQTLM